MVRVVDGKDSKCQKLPPELQTNFDLMQLAMAVLQWKADGAQQRLKILSCAPSLQQNKQLLCFVIP